MSEALRPERETGKITSDGERLEIKRTGTNEVVGYADLLEQDDPPRYELFYISVKDVENRGKGFASQLMSEIERISSETGKPVVLFDAILDPGMDSEHSAVGMYGKRAGWARLRSPKGATKVYVYGPHDAVFDEKILRIYESRF